MSQQATRIRERKTKLTLGFDWEDAFSEIFDTHAGESLGPEGTFGSQTSLGSQQSAAPRPAPVSEDE
jgi:hypothetical protein